MAGIPERPAGVREAPAARRSSRGCAAGAGAALLAAGLLMWLGVRACSKVLDYDVNAPSPAFAADSFVVTGEFRGDGSCDVRLDGQPVAAIDTPRTEYDHDNATGMTPEGISVHEVHCNIAAPFKAGAPYDSRNFWVSGPVRTGEPLRPGRYGVVEEALEPGDTTAMEMAMFHPRFDTQSPRSFLVGYRGYVRITKVDSSTVVGTFRIIAKRHRRSPFS